MKKILCMVMISLPLFIRTDVPNCDHPIYCRGEILHTVQMLGIYKDSKEFVDMTMKYDLNQVLMNWNQVVDKQDVDQLQKVKQFLSYNFLPAGSDIETSIPSDWTPNPPFVQYIKDPSLKAWGYQINQIWRSLSRNFTLDPQRTSHLETPFPFIVPGGRFREFYNWDSLWVLEGLLECGMIDSAINILKNFAYLITELGYVPNGARMYYKGRSQPLVTPLMAKKIYDWLRANGRSGEAQQLVNEMYPVLKKEYLFFRENRGVRACEIFEDTPCSVYLYHYDANLTYPRPESYREDYELFQKVGDEELYRNLGAGAESGWDFSSRWFKNSSDIGSVRASDILAVDLNSFMCKCEEVLSQFASTLVIGKVDSQLLNRFRKGRIEILNKYFYNNQTNEWNDYIISERRLNENFYVSNFFPLAFHDELSSNINLDDINYQIRFLLTTFKGGIPTSLLESGQQWDLPNSWAPLNQVVIEDLENVGWSWYAQIAAQNWINNAYCSYQKAIKTYGEGYMFEKYDATEIGKQGGGGEYEVQAGFGWTNGVTIVLLKHYGDKLVVPSC